MHANSFAARIGRWSTEHRRKALFGWLAFVVVAFVIGNATGTVHPKNTNSSTTGDSKVADRIVDDAYPDKADETVIVQSKGQLTARDPQFRKAVDDVIAGVQGKPGVQRIKSPYAKGNEGQISDNGKSALVSFEIRGDENLAEKRVDAVQAGVNAVASKHADLYVGQFGSASASKEISKGFEDDFKKAGALSLPLTLVILVLTFGALVAAGVPLLLGVSAVMGTLGLLGPISHLVALDEFIGEVVLLVGLAVGVDYTLFYLRREREEKARGASSKEAVAIAAATSGRAVLVSGFTVIAAMAGMLLAGDRTFMALGIGSMLVVLVAMVGSVTAVPALLSGSGKWLDRGRIPFLGRRMIARQGAGAGRAWSFVLDRVLARPLVSAVVAAAVLIVLATPALSMHTATTGVESLPRKFEVMKVYDRMQAAFPGGQIPAIMVIKADNVTTPRITRATEQLKRDALATGVVKQPVDVTVSPDKHVLQVAMPIVGQGTDKQSEAALATIRNELAPKFEDASGQQAYVSGMTAQSKDWNDLMKSRAPIVFAFVLTLAFLLLLVTFRSIVIPIKAIVLNLLSVGAAYGVLVWVFQKGHLEGLLGFDSNGAITSWLPMFLFVILFGLSMDYHVFILSRVREAFDKGMSTEDAVSHGIKSTATVVTSAAFVMVGVFGIFATLSMLDFKMMGIGLATAIFIDATVVRAVLLPATMKLLGDWNWYLPKKLEWLPKVSHEPRVAVDPAKA